ncbi:glycerophosphodiester phosphodiesterase family protein [Trinickia sp. NRRL B-1857]|uniref:glycerophosphodiester phosphodiesterase family protein n=1 Tax=Trinickia sp. NRRL B-1857 TaxID=3162879 RepID=UPI003D2D3116
MNPPYLRPSSYPYRATRARWRLAMLLGVLLVPGAGHLAHGQAPVSVQPRIDAPAHPLIVAHRGGTADTPENTIAAFRNALANGADALWMTVQVTRDGVPVMYRPADLAALTDGNGPVGTLDYAAVSRLNAGYAFKRTDASGQIEYPYRAHPLPIPTLREALQAVPPNVPIMLDMKQTPVAPLVEAVARVLDEAHAWPRVRLYSTDADATALMSRYPQARLFESRDATRQRLVQLAFNERCDTPPAPGTWVGIEFHRQVEVVEHYTLGAGISKVDAHWWTQAAVRCFKSRGDVKVVAFGIETPSDYERATALGIDAVMTDSPHDLRAALTAAPQVPTGPHASDE